MIIPLLRSGQHEGQMCHTERLAIFLCFRVGFPVVPWRLGSGLPQPRRSQPGYQSMRLHLAGPPSVSPFQLEHLVQGSPHCGFSLQSFNKCLLQEVILLICEKCGTHQGPRVRTLCT
ncbi:unnamed protein product, partial [Discosporangium mesarthrocarpum]